MNLFSLSCTYIVLTWVDDNIPGVVMHWEVIDEDATCHQAAEIIDDGTSDEQNFLPHWHVHHDSSQLEAVIFHLILFIGVFLKCHKVHYLNSIPAVFWLTCCCLLVSSSILRIFLTLVWEMSDFRTQTLLVLCRIWSELNSTKGRIRPKHWSNGLSTVQRRVLTKLKPEW